MILARVHPNTLQHGFRCRALHQRESQRLNDFERAKQSYRSARTSKGLTLFLKTRLRLPGTGGHCLLPIAGERPEDFDGRSCNFLPFTFLALNQRFKNREKF